MTARIASSRSVPRSMLAAALVLLPTAVQAQIASERWDRIEQVEAGSPERLLIEPFAIGPYEPNAVTETRTPSGTPLFSDSGPLLQASLQAIVLRIPRIGMLTAGARIGRVSYTASAIDSASGQPTGEETSLQAWLFTPRAGLTLDALARHGVPFVLGLGVGYDLIPWSSTTGEREEGSGLSHGLRWSARLGLELDFAEPRAARRLDEEWGINHTVLFFELAGSRAGGAVPMGAPLSWAVGLSFVI